MPRLQHAMMRWLEHKYYEMVSESKSLERSPDSRFTHSLLYNESLPKGSQISPTGARSFQDLMGQSMEKKSLKSPNSFENDNSNDHNCTGEGISSPATGQRLEMVEEDNEHFGLEGNGRRTGQWHIEN